MNFLDRLQQSFAEFWEYIPALFGAAVVLVAGYLVAKLVQKGAARALRRMHLNDMLRKGGVVPLDRAGAHVNPTLAIANLLFWLVMFSAMLLAANALGLDSLASLFSELVGYIPSVVAAVVIIVVGIVLGDFVGGLIGASTGSLHGGPTLARVGKGGVVLLAVFMSLQELGVATEIVTTAFAIIFGAVALALALSFGLGNRELAGEITRSWYTAYKAERDAIDREVEAEEADVLADGAPSTNGPAAPSSGA